MWHVWCLLGYLATCAGNTELDELAQLGIGSKEYTPTELASYDGTNTAKPILISFKGVVFDVTSGADFYGAKGTYNLMACHEIARSVAEYKLEKHLFHADLRGLSKEKLASMEEIYQETYIKKYPIVGRMVGSEQPKAEL